MPPVPSTFQYDGTGPGGWLVTPLWVSKWSAPPSGYQPNRYAANVLPGTVDWSGWASAVVSGTSRTRETSTRRRGRRGRRGRNVRDMRTTVGQVLRFRGIGEFFAPSREWGPCPSACPRPDRT